MIKIEELLQIFLKLANMSYTSIRICMIAPWMLYAQIANTSAYSDRFGALSLILQNYGEKFHGFEHVDVCLTREWTP